MSGRGHIDSSNRKIALLISVLAMVPALSETLGKSAQAGEGRKELAARAKVAEHERDLSLAAYHHFEVGSAALQIAIVLASAEVIT